MTAGVILSQADKMICISGTGNNIPTQQSIHKHKEVSTLYTLSYEVACSCTLTLVTEPAFSKHVLSQNTIKT